MPIINQKNWEYWVERKLDERGKLCKNVAIEAMRMLEKNSTFVSDIFSFLREAGKNIGYNEIEIYQLKMISHLILVSHSRGQEFLSSYTSV